MASSLKIPESSNIVRVRLIDSTATMTIKSESFIKPVQPGHELINVTDVCFLIEHEASGKKVMFDLGTRRDYWNLPTTILKRLGDVIPSLKVDRDVSDILSSKGVPMNTISSVIWSHYHWDHTGNLALFPSSTTLTTGSGLTTASPSILPGYPDNIRSPLSASDFTNRTHHEISFSDPSTLIIGSLRAHDYFGDGSFYLLDTPGHCTGHICGLARVTTNPSTFIFMGGDICHFAGDFRPSSSLPMPDSIPDGILDKSRRAPVPCPCSLFTDHHPRTKDGDEAQRTSWYEVTDHPRAAYIDPTTARESVVKMQAFDDDPNVLVLLAHDAYPLEILPTFNASPEKDLNVWKANGWKKQCHWGWLNELPRDEDGKKVPGRPPKVEGFWKSGKEWTEGFERHKRERVESEKGKL